MAENTIQQAATPTKSRLKSFWDNYSSLGFALIIVLMIRSSIVESFKIPSGSMIPTLAIGDFLFVNKLAYAAHIPFTSWNLFHTGDVHRGDVIVFKFPGAPPGETIYFIKRVVGIPGDSIELRDKQLYLNGQPVPREALTQAQSDEIVSSQVLFDPQYMVEHPQIFHENLAGKKHLMMLDSTSYRGKNWGPSTVPAESYFAMGDNRDVSNDSRFWGFVPEKNIAGKAMLIWLCFWSDFSRSDIVFHPSRMFTLIQ